MMGRRHAKGGRGPVCVCVCVDPPCTLTQWHSAEGRGLVEGDVLSC